MSYHSVNIITRSFEFPIQHCTHGIENFGHSNGRIYFIFLVASSSYHQILVRQSDQKKLAFFAPSGKRKRLKSYLLVQRMFLYLILLWCSFYRMIEVFYSKKLNTLLLLTTRRLPLYMIIFFNFLTIFQLSPITYLMSHESLLKINYHSSWVNTNF